LIHKLNHDFIFSMGEEDLPGRVMVKQQGKPVAKTSLLRQMDLELNRESDHLNKPPFLHDVMLHCSS
jgi:hypothetical protein